jgi:hypothetical protein
MGHPEPLLDRARLRTALQAALDAIAAASADVEYRLVGTGAALLHGVDLPAADVDILVHRREDVDAFGAALASFPCLSAPVWLPDTCQYYGNYDVDGVEVGISTVEVESEADVIETFGPGPWQHFVPLRCGAHLVPTVALELRLITELYRARPDRVQPLIQFMQVHGCDVDLVRRGMAAAGMSQAAQNEVIEQLGGAPLR